MSILELILENRLIVLSLGLVGLGLFLAFLLILVPQVKRLSKILISGFQKPSEEVETEYALLAEVNEDETDFYEDEEEIHEGPSPSAANPVQLFQEASPKTEESSGDKAIQNIISSVFDDEEAFERKAKLLASAEKIDIHTLALECKQVVSELGFARQGENR